jgi:hypothetical protein
MTEREADLQPFFGLLQPIALVPYTIFQVRSKRNSPRISAPVEE